MDRFLNIIILYVQIYLYYIYISQCFDMVIASWFCNVFFFFFYISTISGDHIHKFLSKLLLIPPHSYIYIMFFFLKYICNFLLCDLLYLIYTLYLMYFYAIVSVFNELWK